MASKAWDMVKPYKFAILILTIPGREEFLKRLMGTLWKQVMEHCGQVTILNDDRRQESKAAKRNFLLDRGTKQADYISFIDDDDLVDEAYVKLNLDGIYKGVDCNSLRGVITDDGFDPRLFEHSIRFNEYKTVTDHGITRYERFPNHLNCIKSDIAEKFTFPETKHRFGDENHGEDTHFAYQLYESGLLKSEHWIEDIIYYYEWRSKK